MVRVKSALGIRNSADVVHGCNWVIILLILFSCLTVSLPSFVAESRIQRSKVIKSATFPFLKSQVKHKPSASCLLPSTFYSYLPPMLSSELLTLGRYLTGVFENAAQAMDEPIWYVRLRLWQRPVPLFSEDSVTLFAEQASIVNLQNIYRQRLLRIQRSPAQPDSHQVQYYSFKNPGAVRGAGANPELLKSLSLEDIDLLPGCILNVSIQNEATTGTPRFIATPPPDARCCFHYNGEIRQVILGFEVNAKEYWTYDKGVDPETGRPLWGALMGPYRYQKTEDWSGAI